MLRNFGLDRKNAIDGSIVAVCPELCARLRIDQLHGHAYLIARALYAPLQESRNSKLLCYVRYILRMARVLRGGCSRDYLQVVDSCQTREDLVLSSRGEVRVARVRAQVVEWEHGDGFPRRRSRSAGFFSRHCITIAATGAGMLARRFATGSGTSVTCAARICCIVAPTNGGRPVSISYATTPSA